MGGRIVSSLKSAKFPSTFAAVLASAILEWVLILMLIVYGIFGYLITRFAHYCELPIPCLLCSRIDNILGREKAGFYWDMICGNHKLEISSLVYCHFHEKLVDVRGMCETCLFSFATKDKSNAETYRLLVGKLGEEDPSVADDDVASLDDHSPKNLKHCCCCNELWNPRRQTLLPTSSTGFDVSHVDAPLCREASEDRDILEKEATTTQVSSTVIHVREMTNDPSVSYEYTDLKISSDSESDIQGASPTVIRVKEKAEDPLVDIEFTEVNISSDNEFDGQASNIHDSLEEVKNAEASSTVIHVREKTEDPLIHFGFTEHKIASDTESDFQASDIHERLEEGSTTQASSTIIHVGEKTEDPLIHFGFTELKITSDTESDIHASDIRDSLEAENTTQASSTIIHVREKTEGPLIHFGFTELKITSDTESDIHASDIRDSLEAENTTQASSTVIHIRERSEDSSIHFGFTELKITSDAENDIKASDINELMEEEITPQASSSMVYLVKERMEDPLINFGFTELKTNSDTESDIQASEIHDRLEEESTTQSSSTIIHVREKTVDDLGYTGLKITSDTESDIQTSDIDEARALISDDPLRDLILESTKAEVEPFISMSQAESVCMNTIDMDVLSPERSQTSSDLTPSNVAHDSPSVASMPDIGHGLEELNWQEMDRKPDVSASAELINLVDDISNAPNSVEVIADEILSNTKDGGPVSPDCSKVDADDEAIQTSKHETNEYQESESLQTSTMPNLPDIKSEQKDAADLQTSDDLELSDAYKLAVGSRGRQLSEKLTEQLTVKNTSSTNLDLKLLLSQFSRGLNSPSNGVLSPRVSRNLDELKSSDSASLTMKLLQKRASLERNDSRSSLDRNESGFESLDFSTVGEIEGETELDRLKRQVEHDRKFLIALLKELEEERNASASATNEAMAMITRLQEEKASLQMEALHHLRMMEEQAEYDMDALDKLNELITEKEKEIQNLEAELDYYRLKYPDDLTEDDVDEKEKSSPNGLWFVTQDEREYISKCLRNLEKKLGVFCDDAKSKGTNGEISEMKIDSDEIVNEVSRLNKRLQVLEADCSFIEHAINALNDGQEELIQEIASHLRELHKIGIRRYHHSSEENDIPPEKVTEQNKF